MDRKERIRSSLTPEDVAGRYGIEVNHHKAVCPFHDDHSPSLSFKGDIFTCFACGAKGDVFAFIMQYEKCSFKDTLKIAARIAGEDLPSNSKKKVKKRKKPAKPPQESLSIYEDFFSLLTLGEKGCRYLMEERGLTAQTLIDAHIVSIEDRNDAKRIESHLLKKYSQDTLIASGLFNERGLIWRRPTVIYPFLLDGKPIYFSNRFLDAGKGMKSLNLKDVRRPLYHIEEKAIRSAQQVYIFEGIMDALSFGQMFQRRDFIAVCGTINLNSLKAIRKITEADIVCVFDNDKAGSEAYERLQSKFAFRSWNWDHLFKVHDIDPSLHPIKDFNDFLLFMEESSEQQFFKPALTEEDRQSLQSIYQFTDDQIEYYIERTAIMHFDGGVSMEEAHNTVIHSITEQEKVSC